jgi:hypothetical protein
MPEQSIPESRTYRHVQCGNETLVSGQSFEVVSNPMSSMEQTMCSACGKMFPIADYEWCDTGENLADYYTRHTTSATDLQRFLCSKKFMVAVIAFFAVLAAAGSIYLVRNQVLLARVICAFGGLVIGAIVGGAVFLNIFEKPITRTVCGVRDTRLLT